MLSIYNIFKAFVKNAHVCLIRITYPLPTIYGNKTNLSCIKLSEGVRGVNKILFKYVDIYKFTNNSDFVSENSFLPWRRKWRHQYRKEGSVSWPESYWTENDLQRNLQWRKHPFLTGVNFVQPSSRWRMQLRGVSKSIRFQVYRFLFDLIFFIFLVYKEIT